MSRAQATIGRTWTTAGIPGAGQLFSPGSFAVSWLWSLSIRAEADSAALWRSSFLPPSVSRAAACPRPALAQSVRHPVCPRRSRVRPHSYSPRARPSPCACGRGLLCHQCRYRPAGATPRTSPTKHLQTEPTRVNPSHSSTNQGASANGRFAGSLTLPNGSPAGAFYLVDPTQGFFIENDGAQVSLEYFAVQTPPEGAPDQHARATKFRAASRFSAASSGRGRRTSR
jgi:hypothetical protein